MSGFRPPEVCPICGTDVPEKALACPECGADERTGWSEAAHTAGLDLPEEDFDYEDFVAREFGGKRRRRRSRLWWGVALALLLGFLGVWLSRFL